MIDLKLLEEEKPISLDLQGESGSGTKNYNDLSNKPTINGTELKGNLTAGDLGIESESIDVQVNGVSIVSDGVANIPIASETVEGVAKVMQSHGIKMNTNNNALTIAFAEENHIRNRNSHYNPIVPKKLDYAVKCAMTDGKGPEWTSEEKASARNRMGVGEYRTLFEATLIEPVGSVEFNTDMDGNAFQVEEVVIFIENCTCGNTRIRVLESLANRGEDFTPLYIANANTTNKLNYFIKISKQLGNNLHYVEWATDDGSSAYRNVTLSPKASASVRKVKYLTRLQIDNNGSNFSEGTRIWVGGR